MKLSFYYSTTKELAIEFGITYDKARYQVNKMVQEGTAIVKNVAGKNYYRLSDETKLTINDNYDLARSYTFRVLNKEDKDLAIHFAASYRTNRKNAQVAMSKFLNSDRFEGTFYGLTITK